MSYVSMELIAHRKVVSVEREAQPLRAGQVRLRVRAANLCPTDVKKWDDALLPVRLGGRSLVLGHEFAGEVTEVGAGVDTVQVGDRVAIDPILRCGRCASCRSGQAQFCTDLLGIGAAAGDPVACAELANTVGLGGGFAEEVVVPALSCLQLPDNVAFASGALVEPLADVMQSVEAARPTGGERAVVIGLGPMGLLHIEALRSAGAEVVGVDLRQDRRSHLVTTGVAAVTPDDMPPADIVCVTAGGQGHVPACQLALDKAAPGARIVLFSSATTGQVLSLDSNRLHYRRQRLIGVVGFDRHHARQAIDLLRLGRIDADSIRHPHVALRDLNEAFEKVLEPGTLKTAIDI